MNPTRIWPIQLAQVINAHPDGRVSVLLESYEMLGEIKVRVRRERARPSAGHFEMPRRGAWGLVAFFRDDMRAGVWLGEVDDQLRNLIPTELWEDDPYATVEHHPSDKTTIQHGDGTTETRWPDGSLFKVTTRKDGSVSNTGKRSSETPRKMSRKTGKMESEREDYAPHTEPPVDAVFDHSSGAQVLITADGSFQLRTPQGHRWRMHDATEKARDPDTGEVTSTPEEDASRTASEVVLESEIGHKLTFKDDPELELDRFARLETPAGHVLELRDKPDDDVLVSVETAGGHILELRDTPVVEARLQTPGGRLLHLDDEGERTVVFEPGALNIAAGAEVTIDAPDIRLAGGASPIARIGDAVKVTIPSGSSAGVYAGEITSGSSKTTSG